MIADGSADGTHREPGADCGLEGDSHRDGFSVHVGGRGALPCHRSDARRAARLQKSG